ncbi:acetyl-CoA carboxylase biotin carboxyl carrier protein [Rhizobiales bacterium GAS113]|nr:acetyl-CoA carboxylase biotin carboxyl carrier protein [Rhizobiales bacterium GAS113]
MPFDHIEEISTWLADAGITLFDLSGPMGRLRLPDVDRKSLGLKPNAAVPGRVDNEPRVSQGIVLTAPTVGVLLHTHPMRDTLLAPLGSRVRAGQVLALLQIGALLVPVSAPRDGQVAGVLAAHGALVGYGTKVIELHDIWELDRDGH